MHVAWCVTLCVALCFRTVLHCCAPHYAPFTQHCGQIQSDATILGLFAPQEGNLPSPPLSPRTDQAKAREEKARDKLAGAIKNQPEDGPSTRKAATRAYSYLSNSSVARLRKLEQNTSGRVGNKGLDQERSQHIKLRYQKRTDDRGTVYSAGFALF